MASHEDLILEPLAKGPKGLIFLATPILKVYFRSQSKYQDILVAETPFGKSLILDGYLQFSEYDEELFHKSVVVPSYKKAYKKVLILGGGDGGVAREILKVNPSASITIVDIDPMVTEAVKAHFPSMVRDVLSSRNVTLINQDAFEFVEKSTQRYDFIVNDVTDIRSPEIKGSQLVGKLYTEDYLSCLKKILNPSGRVVFHLEMFPQLNILIKPFLNTAHKVFKHVSAYCVNIPSFGGVWTFAVLSDERILLKNRLYVESWNRYVKIQPIEKLKAFDVTD